MKRILGIFLVCMILCGCGSRNREMDQVLELRSQLNGGLCHFDAVITADYVDAVYTFALRCEFENSGALRFTVLEPETISGITGSMDAAGGKLTFDDTALAFALLADGQLSPVSGPWVMMKALLSGYITSCGTDGDHTRATIRDSYADDAMTVDIWMTQENIPVRGEIYWDNRRILTVQVENFSIG